MSPWGIPRMGGYGVAQEPVLWCAFMAPHESLAGHSHAHAGSAQRSARGSGRIADRGRPLMADPKDPYLGATCQPFKAK